MKRQAEEWIVFAVSVFFFLLSLDGGSVLRSLAFNADVLYPAVVYQDLIIDGNSLQGWSLTPSPFFFPDLFVYFCLRPWIADGVVSVYVSYLFQVLWLGFSVFYFLGSENGTTGKRRFEKSSATLVYSFFLILPSFFSGTFSAIGFASHGGAFSFSFVSAGMWIRMNARKNAPKRVNDKPEDRSSLGTEIEKKTVVHIVRYVLFAVLQILLLVSDPLYFFYFSLPCGVLNVWEFFVSEKEKRDVRSLLFFGVVVSAGLYCYRTLTRSDFVFLPTGYYTGTPSWNFWKPIEDTIRHQIRSDATALLLLVFAYLSLVPIFVFLKKDKGQSPGRTLPQTRSYSLRYRYLLLSVVLSSLGILGTGTLSGVFRSDGITLRYLIPLLFCWVPLHILVWSEHRNFFKAKLKFLYILILLMIGFSFSSGRTRFSAYEDALVFCLDEKRKEYGFHKGMSDFWTSRRIRVFSGTGLRADNFFPDLHPEYWQNTWNWYTDPSDGEYDFAVTPGLDRNELINSFGPPKFEITCDKQNILIWDETSAERFARFREEKNREIDLWHKLTGRKRTYR
ncbi:hypothetical protein EHQ12_00760 [Leptospira gomenensis]|uniref:DUF2079 domain-containing protein n=1 Tax=Leptospira gomenensis TaxID=2484974 RepID=A0A5F1YG37_9LEPT|nr:hypothetical protein [Leptospira gomenensis]TGK39223.1 hypothetical protein EHQ17_00660 [Leptospira gomenensis]TGK44237.1 hypothetical protein EHQ07_12045 [Leptospira gomenensis]TGK45094.1 hypothetical protein EHQ12_00760 [Leptospira gomenensis]TGK65099.1 hypothetical protein EHQ13_06020 [Leptospira gomenensis]